jgi:ATP-dependent helicase/nuclease subunit A
LTAETLRKDAGKKRSPGAGEKEGCMGRSWTDEQKKVIETRGSSLLVSAAAGSGKTAVLVERILREILDSVHPVDLDRLLIVTFTRAATSQLRERIRDAVTARYEGEPGNEQLRHQMTLLYSDHIMTIDKFFLMVIREHYQQIGLDPSFRIGDEGELKLMRADLISAVLEEAYKEGDPDFLRFSDCYASGISDAALEGMVLDFWESSSSHPWPKEWRHACLRQYLDEPSSWAWLSQLLDVVHAQLLDILENIDQTLVLCAGPGGPKAAQPALLSDRELVLELMGERSYDQLRASFSDMKFARISKKEKKGEEPYDAVKVQMVADLRDSWKKKLGSLREKYFMRPLSEEAELMKRTGADFAVLVRLTDRFEEAFSEEKTRKNILDFTDTAHLALKVLIKKDENGDIVPTQAAREYQDYFEEIAIDEYQDSNEIQELLLSSVSRESRGVYNRFMVGDVKQSIYRFRMSDPGIFMKKYESYRKQEESPDGGKDAQAEPDVQLQQSCRLRIDLHKNFRSRREVLEAVNLVFRQIMRREVGGVSYGADESLYPGAVFEPYPEPWKGQEKTICRPELLLVEPGDVMDVGSESGEKPLPDAMHAEAEVTAARILQIVGHDPVWDKEKGIYRPAEFRDIVILLRTASDWANAYSEVLSAHGIPNRSGSKTGYFSAPEVQTILAYLDVLDNPRQDIPLAAVLRSEIGRLTDDELSMLKAGRRKDSLYDCVETFLSVYAHDRAEDQENSGRSAGAAESKTELTDKGPSGQTSDLDPGGGFSAQQEAALYEKLRQFREMTDRLRSHVSDTPIHQLLWQIYDETGFLAVSEASEGGSQKKANLDMLVEKAIAYEQTSYRGLFHFVRYIDKLIRYEVDFGAALAENGSEDLVRIMTIHASKGLEFPIVFVAGLGRRFNRQDASDMLVREAGIGVGMNYIDPDRRVQVPTLIKSAAAERVIREGIGEELRVLYVALTRAEEKLILTGTVKDRETFVKSLFTAAGCTTEKLPESLILGADGYLKWVSEALVRHQPEGGRFREMADLPQSPAGNPAAGLEGGFLVRTGLEVTARQQHAAEASRKQLAALFDVQPGEVCDRPLHDRLKRQLGSCYPWPDLSEIPAKVTVSELKRQGYEAEMKQLQEAAPASWTQQAERNTEDVISGNAGTAQDTQDLKSGRRDRVVPAFMQEQTQQKPLSGAAAGTIYHRILADYDFTQDAGLNTVLRWLETMVQCDKITEGEKKTVQAGRLVRFLNSELGARMKKAAGKGGLHRENPFVLSVLAETLFQNVEKEAGAEPVLIQGTIDAWFEEAGHLVLVDYKTDYCRPEQKESLVRRYRTQFLLYASALTRLTGKAVGEAWLYSLSLGEAIPVSLAS